MQKRHIDRMEYFREQVETSREYYIDFVSKWHETGDGTRVLEIGCGEGGNLVPFAQAGGNVTGIDIVDYRIDEARTFFHSINCSGTFKCADFMAVDAPSSESDKYDIILLHDVIEHVTDKYDFLLHIKRFLSADGVLFVGFPAWRMPFGGHQQICHSRLCSHLPFFHLLPATLYKSLLKMCGETDGAIKELLDIKRCGTSISLFEKTAGKCGFKILDRTLWLVNPHYKQKFGLTPRKLVGLDHLPYFRDFCSTSCWFCMKSKLTSTVVSACAGCKHP